MSDSDSISTRPPLRELLRNYLGANNAAFLQHASSPNLPESFQGIHQMRVAAKRIRSVYRLMEWLAPERFDARIALRDIRRYFKLAGAVRDLQIREKLLATYCDLLGLSFPRFDAHLRAQRVKAQHRLRKRLPAFSQEFVLRPTQVLLDLLDRMEEETIVRYAYQKVELRKEDIAILMPLDDDAKRLHAVRILLKENLYVMTQVNASSSGPIWSSEEVDHLKEAAEVAGDWHDLDVFVDAITQQQVSHPHIFSDSVAFERLIQALTTDKAKALKNFRKRMKVLQASARHDLPLLSLNPGTSV
jgi:CHAD domain-containing protein